MKKRLISLILVALILTLPICFSVEISLYYDDNGNLLQDKDNYYEYNSLNQLVKVRAGDSSGRILEEYSYDDSGNRIKKVTYTPDNSFTTVYYVDSNFIRVVNSSGSYDTKYYYNNGQLIAREDPGGAKYFYHPDHLGSTNIVTDQSGNVVEETSYSPFGDILEGGESRFTYTGKERDSTALMYYGARYYSPYLRHFTQPDTILPNIYNPQSLNRYSYTLNNPIKYTDPNGETPWSLIAGTIAAGVDVIKQILYDDRSIFEGTIDWREAAIVGISTAVGTQIAIGTGSLVSPLFQGTSGLSAIAGAGSTGAAAGLTGAVGSQVTANVMSGAPITNNVFQSASSGATWGGAIGAGVGLIGSSFSRGGNGISNNPLYTNGQPGSKGYTYLDKQSGLRAMQTGKIPYRGKPIYSTFDKYSKSSIANSKLQLPNPNKAFRAEFPTNQFNKNLGVPSVDGYLDPYTISNPQWGSGGGSQFIIQEDIANVVVRSLK